MEIGRIPSNGINTKGRNAVAAIGMASEIHQIAIQAAKASMALASEFNPGDSIKK
jgi:hypothetical protein